MSQITLPSVQVSRMHLNYLFVGGHLFPKSTEGLKNSEKNVGYTAAYKGVGHWQAGCEPPSFKPFSFQHASVFLLVSLVDAKTLLYIDAGAFYLFYFSISVQLFLAWLLETCFWTGHAGIAWR